MGYRISEEGGFFLYFLIDVRIRYNEGKERFGNLFFLSLLITRIGVGKKDNLLAFFKLFDNDYAIIPFFSSSCILGIG